MVSSITTDVMPPEAVPLTENGNKTEVDHKEKKIVIETDSRSLNYHITESPGIALTIFFSAQQVLSSISGSLTITLLIAELACAERDEIFKGKLLCTTLFISGAATTIQCLVGSRLPLYQGPSTAYIIPLIAMMELPEWKCPNIDVSGNGTVNASSLLGYSSGEELTMHRLQLLMGPLLIVGVLHMSCGMFGLMGYLLKFIGPITVVPAVVLIAFYLYVIASDLAETQWGVAALTAAICVFLSLFLAKKMTPIPYWTRKKGFHIFYYPLHQVLAIMISIVIGWIVSAILTQAGIFSDDPKSVQYFARTDSRNYVIAASNWFFFPYPFQFGSPKFHSGVLIAFVLATVNSILDSIGDYYACASTAKAPLPPKHAINRGIAAEGFATILAGLVGVGHATTTYGGNIGVIGVTKVASRRVFIVAGVGFMMLGVIGKVGAVLVTIPYSVLGGILIVTLGIFIGVVLSNLKHIDLSSTRNMAIIGLALIIGLICPYYFRNHPDAIKTGNEQLDNVVLMIFGNPNFAGTFVACFLDNTVPGTMEERGMITWLNDGRSIDEDMKDGGFYETSEEVYGIPFLPKFISTSRFAYKIPFLPAYKPNDVSLSDSLDVFHRKKRQQDDGHVKL